jgi:hypothetical protein
MKPLLTLLALAAVTISVNAADNVLTEREKADGWLLLFNGKNFDGWTTSAGKESKTPIEDGALNPHKSGHYMMIHKEMWENYVLQLDFKISKKCNSGVFIRTYSLTPRPGKDVGFNGLEIAIDDTTTAGFHDTGALYDLVKPTKNAMKPIGEWNHLEVTSNKSKIEIALNGEVVTKMDTNDWPKPNVRADGSAHKFDVAYKDHPVKGYIGLQDHGSPCWFKNIKLKPIK